MEVVVVGLIDTRPGPDGDDERRREPWPLVALDWVMPWPALIVWLVAASLVTDGWPATLCAIAAMVLGAWRLSVAGGMVGDLRDWKQ